MFYVTNITFICINFSRVTFLEDGKGEAHLRNLSVQSVYTEQEAMKLLYLGDRNRCISSFSFASN